MRICTFQHAAGMRLGVVVDDGVVDLADAAPALPREMTALLAAGAGALHSAANAAAQAPRRLPLASLRLAAPILLRMAAEMNG